MIAGVSGTARAISIACVVMIATLDPLGAQLNPPSDPPANSVNTDPIAVADSLHLNLDARGALAVLREAIIAGAPDGALLWRAARESVHLGMIDEANERPDEARRWFESAEGWARSGLRLNDSDAAAQTWLAIAIGRQAPLAGIRERIGLAGELKRAADRAISLDPDQSGAHHVLGTWHAEVRRLSRVERFTARNLLGGDAFGDAAWERSLEHLLRAVALDPEEIVHRLELARVLDDLDRREEALPHLEVAAALPARHPADPIHIREVERLKQEWFPQR